MKKVILVCLLILIIAGVGLGVLIFIQEHGRGLLIQNVLGTGAIAYIHADHPAEQVQNLMNTEFVRAVKQIKFLETLKALGASKEELGFYRQLYQRFGDQNVLEFLSKMFGRELAIAVYPGTVTKNSTVIERLLGVVSNVSFVTRLSPDMRFIELMTAALSKSLSDFNEETEEYRGKSIHLLTVKGMFGKIGYVRFGDLVVFGIGDQAAKRSIDVVKGAVASLEIDPSFQEMSAAALPQSLEQGFFHYQKFIELMKSYVLASIAQKANMDPRVRMQLEKSFSEAQGFKNFSFSMRPGRVLSSRLDISFDEAKFSDKIRKLYVFASKKNNSLAFIPRASLMYYWNALLSPDFFWQTYQQMKQAKKEETGKGGEAPESGGMFLGWDVSRMLPLLRNEFGWYLLRVDFGKTPLPVGVFFIGVNDAARAKSFVENEIDQAKILKLEKEKYKGVDIESVGNIPFLSDIEPSFCVLNNYFLVSLQRASLEGAVDVASGKKESLTAGFDFGKEEYGFTKPGNAVVYVEVERLANEARKVLDWANQWAGIQDERRKAFLKGAQKRLDEIKGQLASKQKELDALESGLDKEQDQKQKAAAISPEELSGLKKSLEEKSNLLEASRSSLQKLVDEKTRLAKVRADETQELTPEGAARLTELNETIPPRKTRVEQLQKEVDALKAKQGKMEQGLELQKGLAATIDQKETLFKQDRRTMKGLEETQKELEAIVQGYAQTDLPTAEQRKLVLDQMIDPFLDALGKIPWLGMKTRMMEGRIRSDFFMEVH